MTSHPIYYDKELSWLAFNERVLQEAADKTVPIVERIRFLGIYSANLDEFFRVKVARIRRYSLLEFDLAIDKKVASAQLENVLNKVNQIAEQFKIIVEQVFLELSQHHIHMIFIDKNDDHLQQQLTEAQLRWLKKYFANRIIRHITPIILTNDQQLSSCLDEDAIYFLTALQSTSADTIFALVEIPRQHVDRFIVLPTKGSKREKYVMLLDDVIHFFIADIFVEFFDYQSIEAFSFKLTRDADYNLTDELDHSLLDKMSKGLKQRLRSDPARIVYDQSMPEHMKKYLIKSLKIKDLNNLEPGVRIRHFKDFIQFPNLGRKSLLYQEFTSLDSARFNQFASVFSAISAQDILLYYPYHKFRHFTEFVRQASYDPLVTEIKINLYRVAKDSRIINSLIEAVKNGKRVSVVIELRARFDEQANINWAKLMKEAGIFVELGIESLKIHSKLCLVIRKEADKAVRYAHIGTGNFHENSARIYTDFALFTKHSEICQEVENIFSFMSQSYKRFRFKHLIVSPLNSRRRLYQLIAQEIANATLKNAAEITLKVNNLVDKKLIDRLYLASQSGVKIRLVVRGMCSLIPGVKGLSDNIKAISIVDQFLEHPRVMIFSNNNQPLVFISSADWMERNIDSRVEVACPIYDENLKKRIINIINLHFKDTTKARIINKEQDNRYNPRGNHKKIRSQVAIYDYLVAEESGDEISCQSLRQELTKDQEVKVNE